MHCKACRWPDKSHSSIQYLQYLQKMAKDFDQIAWDELAKDECRRLVRAAVLEDLDRGQDWTTVCLVPPMAQGKATVVARQPGIIAGLPALEVIRDEMDSRIKMINLSQPIVDGMAVQRGTTFVTLEGPARSLLTAERLILNLLGRLSGIATLTSQFVQLVADSQARIYDTRKTTPGWRRLEKYAVRQGGGRNHRTGLFDAILIKDNHLAFGGQQNSLTFSPAEAVRQARQFSARNFPEGDPRCEMIIEIEVDSLAQLEIVLPQRPQIVLLDNMDLNELRRAVEIRDSISPSVQLEASGGVNLKTVRQIAETGIDRISSGALTHSAISLDIALDWAS